MIRHTQTVIIAALTLGLLIALPSLLLWGAIAYTQEQTRVGLVEWLGLSEDMTYAEAIRYFDCGYLYEGMPRANFEARLDEIGDYKMFPKDALNLSDTTVSIDFPTFTLSRTYVVRADTISRVSKITFGAVTQHVSCAS